MQSLPASSATSFVAVGVPSSSKPSDRSDLVLPKEVTDSFERILRQLSFPTSAFVPVPSKWRCLKSREELRDKAGPFLWYSSGWRVWNSIYIIKNFMDGPVDILLFQNHQDYNHPLSGMDRGNERPEPRNTDTSNTSTFPIFPLKLSI